MKCILLILPVAIALQSAHEYQKLWDENIQKLQDFEYPERNSEFENYDPEVKEYSDVVFDYIIVGAGSAGATVAARLGVANKSVLLLEAGGDETEFSIIPGAFYPNMLSELNWGYRTTSQKNACFKSIDNKCDLARGKVLGGSSGLNGMLYTRGDPRDFDKWEEMGNEGWSYKNVEKYFQKLENASGLNVGASRGCKGPITLSYNTPQTWYNRDFIEGYKNMGYVEKDYNVGEIGNVVAEFEVTTRNGRRDSTNQAYLKRLCKHCSKLKVQTKALATKILLDNHIATGVQFIHKGQLYVANAKQEVIVSAGAYNTPQLLLLSGIGPKNELEPLGIATIADLPQVGKNLDDHPSVFSINFDTNITLDPQTYEKLFIDYTKGRGLLTYTGGQQISYNTMNKNGVPQVEIMTFQPYPIADVKWHYKIGNLKPVMKESTELTEPNSIINYVILLHPKSRGEVTLKSSNPIDFPNINPNFLAEEEDTQVLYQGIKDFLRILEQPSMKKIGARLTRILIPQCSNLKDYDYWKCVIQHRISSMFHPSSTCKMGQNRQNSVVDNKLLVHGFKNLRIADTSVMPTQTSGHINAVAIMIGEKTADEILNR